eukprot:TRINITY_DN4634_c0_g2_i2.p1 TRINITY_DN4634_c0_g2~~TRINITY_DN4634_c0_g2_i2.p1  ORF type:complete len:1322 (+),score=514.36 TRINITY_DN4634_c0_g2_i2:78-4043(+)
MAPLNPLSPFSPAFVSTSTPLTSPVSTPLSSSLKAEVDPKAPQQSTQDSAATPQSQTLKRTFNQISKTPPKFVPVLTSPPPVQSNAQSNFVQNQSTPRTSGYILEGDESSPSPPVNPSTITPLQSKTITCFQGQTVSLVSPKMNPPPNVGQTPSTSFPSFGRGGVDPRTMFMRRPSIAAYIVDDDSPNNPSTSTETSPPSRVPSQDEVSGMMRRSSFSRQSSFSSTGEMPTPVKRPLTFQEVIAAQANADTPVTLHRPRTPSSVSFGALLNRPTPDSLESVTRQIFPSEEKENNSMEISQANNNSNNNNNNFLAPTPQKFYQPSSDTKVGLFNGGLVVRNSYIVDPIDIPDPKSKKNNNPPLPIPIPALPSHSTASITSQLSMSSSSHPTIANPSPSNPNSAAQTVSNLSINATITNSVSVNSNAEGWGTPTTPTSMSRRDSFNSPFPAPVPNRPLNPNIRKMISNLNSDQLTELVLKLTQETNAEDELVGLLNQEEFIPDSIKAKNPEKDSVFTWNEKFQSYIKAVRDITSNTRQEDQIKVYETLARHSHDFIYTATTYGKIIISEVALPPEEKTIKPLSTAQEGAGGEKYFCKGIYFKFAVNSGGIYPGDEEAAKVAGHELKSLNQLFSLWIKDFHYPMMILLDYRGYRLIAMSTIPITKDTIVYGSCDAGRHIHADNLQVNEKIREVSKRLKLKEHKVGPKLVPKTICTPVDLEVHRGIDHRFYLLDFSRLFPPVTPDGTRSAYLYKLFRPEFSQKYHLPLCSDAFSNFIKAHDYEVHNEEIIVATKLLKEQIIPNFAKDLKEMAMEHIPDYKANFPNLLLSLHSSGINIRFLGEVRVHLSEETSGERYWRFIILLEMISRTIKQHIRELLRNKMKKLRQTGEEPYKRMIIRYLNILFGDVTMSKDYWAKDLKELIIKKFPVGLSPQELDPNYNFKEKFAESIPDVLPDGRSLLFTKISEHCGFSFSTTTKMAFESRSVYQFQRPLDETDLEDLEVRVKSMNIVQHSEGFILKLKASKRTGDESTRLFELAIQKFKAAIESDSNNKVTLRNLADCLTKFGDNNQADKYFKDAIIADPRDSSTLWKYGMFNESVRRFDLAEECYLLSLEADLSHSNCSAVYADFLASCRKNFIEAESFYQMAIGSNPKNAHAINNYSCFLMCIKRDFQRAENYFKMSIIVDPEQPIHIQNFALFYQRIKKLQAESLRITRMGQEVEKRQLMRTFDVKGIAEFQTNSPNDGEESKGEKRAMTNSQKRNWRRKKLRQLHKEQKDLMESVQDEDGHHSSSSSSGRSRTSGTNAIDGFKKINIAEESSDEEHK